MRHHNLNDGDVVTIGQHELLYIDERAQRRRSAGELRPSSTTVLAERPSRAQTL